MCFSWIAYFQEGFVSGRGGISWSLYFLAFLGWLFSGRRGETCIGRRSTTYLCAFYYITSIKFNFLAFFSSPNASALNLIPIFLSELFMYVRVRESYGVSSLYSCSSHKFMPVCYGPLCHCYGQYDHPCT